MSDEKNAHPSGTTDEELEAFLAEGKADREKAKKELQQRLTDLGKALETHRHSLLTSTDPGGVKDLIRHLLADRKKLEARLKELAGA